MAHQPANGASNDPSSLSDARRYLELVATLPFEHIGPHRRFREPKSEASALRTLAPRVTGAVQRLDERTYLAPSPWHAAAWMLDLAGLVGQVADVDAESGLQSPFAAKHGAPVFRGQREPEWKLIPKLLRKEYGPRDHQALELLIRALSEIFEVVAEDTRMNSRHVHMAAAQHYEMPTTLLDFTADPRVAVFFACEDALQDRDAQVVVYGMPYGMLDMLGGAVVLPPPWVKRLYAQRGFFLDCSKLLPADDLREFCFRVLFPPDPDYGASLPGCGLNELYPPNPWYSKAIKWAVEIAHNDPSPSRQSPGDALIQACGKPPFIWQALDPSAAKDSIAGFVDMLEWLALKSLNGTHTYDLNTLLSILRHNEPLFRSHRVQWKFIENLFPGATQKTLRQNRIMAAMEAASLCVEEGLSE